MTPLRLRVKDLRIAKGMTQQGLAEAAGVRQATISEIESGRTRRIDFEVLERLAEVLQVEPGSLVERVKVKRRSASK